MALITPSHKNKDSAISKPCDRDNRILNRVVFFAPFILVLIGIVAYCIIAPRIYGDIVSFIKWLVSDPKIIITTFIEWLISDSQSIVDLLQNPIVAFGKLNYIFAIRVFWYVWLASFIISLFFACRQFQKKSEAYATNAILVGKEPFFLTQDIVTELNKIEFPNDNIELKYLLLKLKRLEEQLSVESDFGYGSQNIINCENEIARKLQFIYKSVSQLSSGNVSANIMGLKTAMTILNSLLSKRTELKKK